MNFFTSKNPDILRLVCKKSISSGNPVIWDKKDDFKCASLELVDDVKIEVKETGWYQTVLRLIVKQDRCKRVTELSEDVVCFLAAVQQNSEAISLYYSDVANSNVTTVCLTDINYFNKGDRITVVVGMCNVLDVQEEQNVLSIIKV